MLIDDPYDKWLEKHRKARRGERLRRLQEGHAHAERLFVQKVWYPAMGHLEHLHPEYEINDYRDGCRYLDFAYIRPPFRLCIEIDGYGPHFREISRRRFAEDLMRQNHLILDGWKVLRFAFDDISEKPRQCQQLIQQGFGRWIGIRNHAADLPVRQKEIILLAVRKQAPITLSETAELLRTSKATARKELRTLVQKKLLAPLTGEERIYAYRIQQSNIDAIF